MDRQRFRTRTLVAGVAAVAAVVGAGVAVAATTLGSPQQESQAVIDDAAKQLGVKPDALSTALKRALENRIDAAVAAGRLTKEQADRLKARIESRDFPLFFGHGPRLGHRPFARFANLDAAVSYLGVTRAELRTALASGKSLADVAKEQGKSVDGLVDALVEAAKKKLDAAVAAGRLTDAQRQQVVGELKERLTDFVNRPLLRGRGPGFGFGFRHGFRGERHALLRPIF